ncbi:hypothetical protein Unana1_04630 [Umbelopsis nana]
MADTATEPVIDTPVAATESTGSEEVNLKQVFVGNLPFKTTEEDLIKFFEVAGKVEKASIVTRGRRSLGYGFVSFETQEDASKAAKELDKKEFGTRQVNVEIAKPQAVNGTPKPRAHGPSKRRPRREHKEENADAVRTSADASVEDKEIAEALDDAEKPAVSKSKSTKKRAPRKQQPKAPARIDGATRGEPSKTTLFVGNLPFATDDDGLKDILKNYRVKSAHVVKRKTGRSKGFGFVEMEDEAEQQKVLDELKTVTVDGREVSIKVSVSVPHTTSTDNTVTEDASAATPAGDAE